MKSRCQTTGVTSLNEVSWWYNTIRTQQHTLNILKYAIVVFDVFNYLCIYDTKKAWKDTTLQCIDRKTLQCPRCDKCHPPSINVISRHHTTDSSLLRQVRPSRTAEFPGPHVDKTQADGDELRAVHTQHPTQPEVVKFLRGTLQCFRIGSTLQLEPECVFVTENWAPHLCRSSSRYGMPN